MQTTAHPQQTACDDQRDAPAPAGVLHEDVLREYALNPQPTTNRQS